MSTSKGKKCACSKQPSRCEACALTSEIKKCCKDLTKVCEECVAKRKRVNAIRQNVSVEKRKLQTKWQRELIKIAQRIGCSDVVNMTSCVEAIREFVAQHIDPSDQDSSATDDSKEFAAKETKKAKLASSRKEEAKQAAPLSVVPVVKAQAASPGINRKRSRSPPAASSNAGTGRNKDPGSDADVQVVEMIMEKKRARKR